MTQRFAMAVRLKEEKREFYIKNHANVWPEVLDELKKIKVKNYSIYLKEDFMFGYLEYDGSDFNKPLTLQSVKGTPSPNTWLPPGNFSIILASISPGLISGIVIVGKSSVNRLNPDPKNSNMGSVIPLKAFISFWPNAPSPPLNSKE